MQNQRPELAEQDLELGVPLLPPPGGAEVRSWHWRRPTEAGPRETVPARPIFTWPELRAELAWHARWIGGTVALVALVTAICVVAVLLSRRT